MKVVMTEHFYPDSAYTKLLAEELSKNVDLTVLCRRGAEDYPDHFLPVLYQNGQAKPAAAINYMKSIHDMKQEIKHRHPDILHVQSFKKESVEIPVYMRIHKAGIRLVHTVHNLLPHEENPGHKDLYGRFYDSCDLLVAHNVVSRDILTGDYGIPEDRIIIAKHGAYRATPVYERHEKLELLIFGIIRHYKGIKTALKALSLIPEEMRHLIHLTIAGKQYPGLDDTDYIAMAKVLNVEDMVSFRLEYIPESDIGSLFRASDICLFPYESITTSGALLMAYSHGKPVIASNIPVFREETDNGATGILIPKRDPVSLKNAIISMLIATETELDAYQNHIDRLIRDQYSWEMHAKALTDAYNRLKGVY